MREDIAEVRDAFSAVHMRMAGGSLLIIYEADWAAAEEGLKHLSLEIGKGGKGVQGREEEEGSEEEEEEKEEEEEEEEEEEDDDDDDDDNDAKRPGPPYIVKLIDFAHTHITPGQGPDEGVLLGFDTVLKLIDGRIEQIRAQQ